MKPGKRDIRYPILISGTELVVLQKLTFMMAEAFGLDRKIEAYKGTRPITFYSWDLDCLEAVMSDALDEPTRNDITTEPELAALQTLDARLRALIDLRE